MIDLKETDTAKFGLRTSAKNMAANAKPNIAADLRNYLSRKNIVTTTA